MFFIIIFYVVFEYIVVQFRSGSLILPHWTDCVLEKNLFEYLSKVQPAQWPHNSYKWLSIRSQNRWGRENSKLCPRNVRGLSDDGDCARGHECAMFFFKRKCIVNMEKYLIQRQRYYPLSVYQNQLYNRVIFMFQQRLYIRQGGG